MKKTQTERLYELLKDGLPHRTDEILRVVYGSEHQCIARIGARGADLKEEKWPGEFKCTIEGYKDPEKQALYFYKLIPPKQIDCRRHLKKHKVRKRFSSGSL